MEIIERTLLVQLQITEHEIKRRRELLHFTDADLALLKACHGFIELEIDEIIERFYRLQTAVEEIAVLIGDFDTLRRLHAAQRTYVLDLFTGRIDLQYVENRLRIGLVDKRIGVEPKLYLSAVNILKDILYQTLEGAIGDRAVLAGTCRALDKLLYFDVTLVFDTYILSLVSQVESAKGRVEKYAASLELQVAERTRQLADKVAQLEAALLTVKRLEGVIPICGVCKKIRNDQESWEQLEQYISEHSEAMFSHGLCPDCYEKEMQAIRRLKGERDDLE